jgi:hypothetical protein
MAWHRRPRDFNIMFAVSYRDGRTAYLTISPKVLESVNNDARKIACERQEKGEIPDGEISVVKRVR